MLGSHTPSPSLPDRIRTWSNASLPAKRRPNTAPTGGTCLPGAVTPTAGAAVLERAGPSSGLFATASANTPRRSDVSDPPEGAWAENGTPVAR